MSFKELSREEAKKIYENGETIAIVFDNRNPYSRVYEFSVQTEEESDFDNAVAYFEAKKILWYKLEFGAEYEEIFGQKHTTGFYAFTDEEAQT